MKGLRISTALELPIDVVGEVTAILAKRGAGKTTTAKVIVEEVLDHGGVQVVVHDPVGVWWGLRVGAAGGARGGYDVAVFGGEHGDLPLEPTAGKLLAETVVDSGQSMILDVSGFDFSGEMQRFVYEFCEQLYKLKQGRPTPLLLVLEEADEFAPQNTQGSNVPRMVGAVNRIAKRGRGRGVGLVPVTQRSAALNKNTLDQADTLIAMRTIGPRDREAIEGWVKHQQADGMDLVIPSLPQLQTGEAWVWTPERGLLKRVKVRRAKTLDVRPIGVGEAAPQVTVKQIDLEALGAKMKATVERVKSNDPAELKKRIRELERQVAARELETVVETETVIETVEVPAIAPEELGKLRMELAAFRGDAADLKRFADVLEELLAPVAAGIEKISGARASAGGRGVAQARTDVSRKREPPAAPPPPPPAAAASNGEVKYGKGERTVLEVLAEYPEGRTVSELAFLAGYSAKASTIGVILSNLRKAGYVGEGNQPVRPTEAGLDQVGGAREQPTGSELLEKWLRHPRIGEGERRVLLTLLNHDGPISHEELAELTGYSPIASTLGVILSKLRKLGLVQKGSRQIAPEFREAVGAL